MDRKLIKQIKTLRSIKPARAWNESTRDILLSQIRAQEVSAQPTRVLSRPWVVLSGSISAAFHALAGGLFAHPTALAATVTMFLAGSTSAVFVAEQSIPGEPLYPVKLTKEQVAIALATDPDSRTKIELGLVAVRLNELSEVANRPAEDENRDRQVEQIAQTVADNLSNVTKKLDSIKKIGEPHKVAKLATSVAQATEEYEKTIAGLENSSANDKLGRVIETIDRTNTKALEVIVEKKDSAGISEESITKDISQKIEKAAQKLEKIKVTMAASATAKSDAKLAGNAREAESLLEAAKDSMAKKDYKTALASISQTADLMAGVAEKLQIGIIAPPDKNTDAAAKDAPSQDREEEKPDGANTEEVPEAGKVSL